MVSDDQGAKRVDDKQCCNCRIPSNHMGMGSRYLVPKLECSNDEMRQGRTLTDVPMIYYMVPTSLFLRKHPTQICNKGTNLDASTIFNWLDTCATANMYIGGATQFPHFSASVLRSDLLFLMYPNQRYYMTLCLFPLHFTGLISGN